MRKLYLFALTFIIASLNAKTWNDKTLQDAAIQAKESINLFIQKNRKSDLYQALNQRQQEQLRKHLKFLKGKPQTFQYLKSKDHVGHFLYENIPSYESIPYLSLYLQYTSPEWKNRVQLSLIEAILRSDDASARYAFTQAEKLDLRQNEKLNKERERLFRQYGFRYTGFRIDDVQTLPEICLQFSKHLRPEPAQRWQAMIKVTPKPSKPLAYRGDQVCFYGKWQTTYQVQIDKRIQSKSQLHLRNTANDAIITGNRRPTIRFASKGRVLTGKAPRLALTTANIDDVTVKLWQVPANNLANAQIQSLMNAPQDMWPTRLIQRLKREGSFQFSGSFPVGRYNINEEVTTSIALSDMLGDTAPKAGIFVMMANNSNDIDNSATLVFTLSNTGFSAYLTDAGLWAELRHLSDTTPVSGQHVTLYALNNTILGKSITNTKGIAYFDKPAINGKDGLRPSHLISESDGYFAYLDVKDQPVDLSNKGLSGELQRAPLRSWIWSDRGIYRPNDTAHIMWLLKNPEGKAFHSAPIWLELVRPDGKVLLDKMIVADDSGAYNFEHYFSNIASHGAWHIRLSLGKNGALLATKELPLSAITPDQIEVEVTPLDADLRANVKTQLGIQVDWLYGAPATQLLTSLSQRIKTRTLRENHEQEGQNWQDWQIGLHDETELDDQYHSKDATTNQDGQAFFPIEITSRPFSTKPLQMHFTVEAIEPSGKSVETTYQRAIARAKPYLALKVDKNDTNSHRVQVALLDDSGTLQAGEATWMLYRVNYNYYWYKKSGKWQWQFDENRQLFKSGDLFLNPTLPTELTLPLDDGDWVVVVRGNDASIAASINLSFGRHASPKKGTAPDQIRMNSEFERYIDGETVSVQLYAPFDGKASVKFALEDRIIDNRELNFVDGQATLTFKWQQGLWLLANAWNEQQQNVHNRRAVGLHWLGGDLTVKTIDLDMDLPKLVEPNRRLTIPLHLKDASKISQHLQTWARVAVVDEGLYRLAKPSFRNPLDAFWAKKQINVGFFDTWGDIISAVDGRDAALRSGADGIGESNLTSLKALPELDLTLIAHWSKPVAFDNDGNASVSIDLPQFNGRVRVMVAAWNEEQLGAIEKSVIVRAPLVTTLFTPKYLSPNDSSNLKLRLHNTTDKPMQVTPRITPTGLNLDNDVAEMITLAPDQETWIKHKFRVAEDASGRATFTVNINDIQLERFIDIRPKHYPEKSQTLYTLERDNHIDISAITKGKPLERKLFISTQAPFDPAEILTQLNAYPYGCVEQLTSKSWNNLLLPDLIPRYQLKKKRWGNTKNFKERLFTAQSKLANFQSFDGGFSLWGGESSDTWLTAYVAEFLVDAQRADTLGNQHTLSRTLDYLRQVVMNGEVDDATAYAHYVLAKAGAPVQGATMRFAETILRQSNDTFAVSELQLVLALVYHGETTLATTLLNRLVNQEPDFKRLRQYQHFGASVRNIAQSLVVLSDLRLQLTNVNADKTLLENVQRITNKLWQPLQQNLAHTQELSTQDLHWLAALARTLPNADDTAKLSLNRKSQTFFKQTTLEFTGDKALSLSNQGATKVYVTVNDWVIPNKEVQFENGLRIALRYEDKEGSAIDINQLKQNQRIFAIATITPNAANLDADILFAYPLPAGLTASNVSKTGKQTWQSSRQTPRFSKNRDDRHLAAFHVIDEKPFTHVFLLTAITKGKWHAPAYTVENMYQPQYRAVYPQKTVIVK